MSSNHLPVSGAEYKIWMALYDDLDPDAVLEWLTMYEGSPRSEVVAASSAWAQLQHLRARAEVLMH